MAKHIPEQKLQAIEAVVSACPEGIGVQGIQNELEKNELEKKIVRRTLQYRLKHLVEEGRIVAEGKKRWVKYRPLITVSERESEIPEASEEEIAAEMSVSKQAVQVQKYARKPVQNRKPVGYNREFLDSYKPNDSSYLSDKERKHLYSVGASSAGEQPAGTYAKQILNRLLIDLSWNSSRLEGNTYSFLDTRRLIEFGEEASGKKQLEGQMILNHKEAIEFLVGSVEEISLNRHTILNLHALLANNLLADPEATGRLRRIAVGIEKSVFQPLEVPQLIEECFEQILATAAAIQNPFEQSLFVMVHFPYLQPFDDVNKRVSRLAANIPLIQANLTPLSFTDVTRKTYTEAILGVYELNNISLLKDIYIWAYERSAMRYTAVRQSLGEPDPFRVKYRTELREIVKRIVLEQVNKKSAFHQIATWARKNIEASEREQFKEVAEIEVLGLHEGNFARFQIKPSQFKAWQDAQ